MKKILFFAQLPPPIHGVTTVNERVLGTLRDMQDHSIAVLPIQLSGSIEEIGAFSFIKLFKTALLTLSFLKELIFSSPDLIYFTFSPVGSTLFRDVFYVLVAKSLRIPVLFHLHGQNIRKLSNNSPINERILKFVFKGESVICLSESLKTDLAGIFNGKPYVVNNCVQTVSDVKGHSSDVVTILYLSSVSRDKGIYLFIDIIESLYARHKNIRARVAGNPYRVNIDEIKNIIANKGLSKVIELIGPVYDVDKEAEFRNADIFILPSYNEAFPLVLLEAMSYGLPVVASRIGAIPEIVTDNETGFVAGDMSVASFADRIAALIDDPVLRQRLAANAQRRQRDNYSPRIFNDSVRRVFGEVLHE